MWIKIINYFIIYLIFATIYRFIDSIVLFDIIHGPYSTILTIFYLYLQLLQQ